MGTSPFFIKENNMEKIKKFKNESGQALVEFALILPILLLLAGPAIDLGRAVYAKTTLQNISEDITKIMILEKEYSHQGGSLKAMEDKVWSYDNEDRDKIYDEYGQEVKFVPKGYLRKEMIKSYVEDSILDYDKLKVSFSDPGNAGISSYSHKVVDRFDGQGGQIKSSTNKTYYREMKMSLSYDFEYITFMGKKLLGDGLTLKEEAVGLIYRGGDGRDVTDPIGGW